MQQLLFGRDVECQRREGAERIALHGRDLRLREREQGGDAVACRELVAVGRVRACEGRETTHGDRHRVDGRCCERARETGKVDRIDRQHCAARQRQRVARCEPQLACRIQMLEHARRLAPRLRLTPVGRGGGGGGGGRVALLHGGEHGGKTVPRNPDDERRGACVEEAAVHLPLERETRERRERQWGELTLPKRAHQARQKVPFRHGYSAVGPRTECARPGADRHVGGGLHGRAALGTCIGRAGHLGEGWPAQAGGRMGARWRGGGGGTRGGSRGAGDGGGGGGNCSDHRGRRGRRGRREMQVQRGRGRLSCLELGESLPVLSGRLAARQVALGVGSNKGERESGHGTHPLAERLGTEEAAQRLQRMGGARDLQARDRVRCAQQP